MFLLAEASQAPNEIKVWLECLAFLVALVVGVLMLVDRLKVKPNPTLTYPTKAELERHINENRMEHQNFFAKLGGVERGLRDEVKKDVNELHEKVNAVAREVSSLTTSTDLQTVQLERIENTQEKRLSQIEGKLDQTIRDQGKGRH